MNTKKFKGKSANINHVIQSKHKPNHKYFKVNTRLLRTSGDDTIQEFYKFYDAKLHNLWRYKFTNAFNLSKATPCSLGHTQGGQVSSSKGCIDHLQHQNAHRI